VYFVVAETRVEGSTIPETVVVETVAGEVEGFVPVAGLPEGAAPGPEAPMASEDI
jgi:hypothetical protein